MDLIHARAGKTVDVYRLDSGLRRTKITGQVELENLEFVQSIRARFAACPEPSAGTMGSQPRIDAPDVGPRPIALARPPAHPELLAGHDVPGERRVLGREPYR